MVLKADQERVKTLIRDTVTLLCKNGLEFRNKFSLEALIGVTLDEGEVVLLSINELVQADGYAQRSPAETSPAHTSPRKRRKRSRSGGQIKAEVSESDGGEELVFVKEELVADQTWPEVSADYADPVVEASSAAGIPGTSFSTAMVDMNLLESNQQQTEWVSQGSDGSYGNTATTTVTMASAGQQGTMATTGSQDDMTGQLSGDPLDQQQQVVSPIRKQPNRATFGMVELSIDAVTKRTTRICKYPGCTFTAVHRSGMVRHQRRHTNSYFSCPQCEKQFVEKYSLSVHIRSVHNQEKYICKVCGKILISRTGLYTHEKKHQETNTVKYQCSFCPELFDNLEVLAEHIGQHTKSSEPIEVVVETDVQDLATPNPETPGVLRYCPIEGCTFASVYRSSMSRHRRRCHTKEYLQCEFCDKTYIEKYELSCHVRSAHENIQFPCTNCEKSFKYPSSLKAHKLKGSCVQVESTVLEGTQLKGSCVQVERTVLEGTLLVQNL